MIRPTFAALLLLATAACDLGAGDPDIQFSNSLLPNPASAEASASVQPGNDAVYGAGIIVTPNTCQKLTPSFKVNGSALTITITASNQRTECPGGIGAYTYQFSIEGIDAQRYDLKVVYDFSGQRPAQTVLQEEIIVT
jgi:hypothetical protein